MATIPSGQKFHTLASFVETEEKGSALVNSGREIYTMQDIIDTVPSGGGTNPTSGVMPYNNGGVFADSSLRVYPDTIYGTGIPFGIYNIGNPVYGGSLNLNIDDVSAEYSIGQANIFGSPSAWSGIAINGNYGEAIIGVGMSSPSNGVFRASSGYGTAWIGNGIDGGIGYNFISGRMHVGFGLIQNTGTYSQVAWIKVTDEIANEYYIPLYQ